MAIIWVGTGRFNAYIGPVQDYIDRVVAADVAAGNTLGLEVGVRDAYDVFIRDSINVGDLGTSGGVLSQANSIIKAAPIMAGARTLPGCLVPLVGTAPTRFGTEGGWNYNRRTGLAGNGTNNYLNSNRLLNAQPQNSIHLASWVTNVGAPSSIYMGALTSASPLNTTQLGYNSQQNSAAYLNGDDSQNEVPISAPTLYGASRASSNNYTVRVGSVNRITTDASLTPGSLSIAVFARNSNGTFNAHTTARLSFYSIGESLDLAQLDSRLATLMNAIAAAIP
jgi:hypothetical protein